MKSSRIKQNNDALSDAAEDRNNEGNNSWWRLKTYHLPFKRNCQIYLLPHHFHFHFIKVKYIVCTGTKFLTKIHQLKIFHRKIIRRGWILGKGERHTYWEAIVCQNLKKLQPRCLLNGDVDRGGDMMINFNDVTVSWGGGCIVMVQYGRIWQYMMQFFSLSGNVLASVYLYISICSNK